MEKTNLVDEVEMAQPMDIVEEPGGAVSVAQVEEQDDVVVAEEASDHDERDIVEEPRGAVSVAQVEEQDDIVVAEEASDHDGRYMWRSVAPVGMMITKGNLDKIIGIIEKSTLCTDWAKDVRKQLADKYDEKKEVPNYVMSFYDMTGGHEYEYKDDKPTVVPWIQRQMTEERMLDIQQRISLYDRQGISCKPNQGDKYLPTTIPTNFSEDMNITDYLDSVVESTSWSVTNLFMHRCIRVVNGGEEEDNKYCFWPLCQPMVNHRPVGVDFITGFVTAMKGKKSFHWENQSGAVIPYCVAKKDDDEEKAIALEFMINSGQSATNAKEYVGSEFNLPAGPVKCVGCEGEELDKCFSVLTGSDISDLIPQKKRGDVRYEVLFKTAAILNALKEIYGSLKTWSDWLDLYMQIWNSGSANGVIRDLEENREVHPSNFNDLTHKTTMCFQATHRVRFPFAEAQKRVCGAVCTLTNWKPTTEVKYHEFACGDKNWQIDPEELFATNINLVKADDANSKIRNCATSVPIMVMQFREPGREGLTETALSFARELSKKWTISGDKSERRDWSQMLKEICTQDILRKAIIPPFYDFNEDLVNDVKIEGYQTWATNVRRTALVLLYNLNFDCAVLTTDLAQATKELRDSKKSVIPDIQDGGDYADFCTLRAISSSEMKEKKTKMMKKFTEEEYGELDERDIISQMERQKKNGLNKDGGIYLQKPPNPPMPNLIASLFSTMASGAKGTVDAISHLAHLDGARVDVPRFRSDMKFLENEPGYRTSGFFNNSVKNATFLLYGVYKTVDMLVEVIFGGEGFQVAGVKSWKIQHVLRNVLAFHIFRIYETYGLRVPIPTYVKDHNPEMAEWFHTGFLKSCEYLKKDLPDGKYTATNVPFIVAFIVLCIKQEQIYVKAEIDGKVKDISELFIGRTGDVVPMETFFNKKLQENERCQPDDLWYFQHVKLRFGWTGYHKRPLDFEELFQMVVYGGNPFDCGTYDSALDDAMVDLHFRARMRPIMAPLKIEAVDKVLRIVVVQEAKAKNKAAPNGWLAAKEYGKLKDILKDKTIEDDSEKRKRMYEEMKEMQQTYMAKIVNIGMHMAIWAPTEADIEMAGEDRETPNPLLRMTNLKEESLNLLRAPVRPPKRGKKRKSPDEERAEETPGPVTIMEYPVGLTKMSTDLLHRTNKLVDHCRERHFKGKGLHLAYEELCQLKKPPTYKDYYISEEMKYAAIEQRSTVARVDGPVMLPMKEKPPPKVHSPPTPKAPQTTEEDKDGRAPVAKKRPQDKPSSPLRRSPRKNKGSPTGKFSDGSDDEESDTDTHRVRGGLTPEKDKNRAARRTKTSESFKSPDSRLERNDGMNKGMVLSDATKRRMQAEKNAKLKSAKKRKELAQVSKRLDSQDDYSRARRPTKGRTSPGLGKQGKGSMLAKVSKSLRGLVPESFDETSAKKKPRETIERENETVIQAMDCWTSGASNSDDGADEEDSD